MALRHRLFAAIALACSLSLPALLTAQSPYSGETEVLSLRPPDFAAMLRDQEATDRAWRSAGGERSVLRQQLG